MPGLDPQMLDLIASDWDPTPFLQAIEQGQLSPAMAPGGAMDEFGAASHPTGAVPDSGMGFGTIFADAPTPGKPGAKQPGMAAIPAGAMAPPPPQQMAPSGGLARNPAIGAPPPGFPGMPRPGRIPSLAEILGGR